MALNGVKKPYLRKRNRVVLVCNSCKEKKIKCDKGSPCSGCIKRGTICEYNQIPTVTSPDGDSDLETHHEEPIQFANQIGKTILDETITNFQLITVINKPGKTIAASYALQGPTIRSLMEFKHVLQPNKTFWKNSHRKVQYSLSEVYLKDPTGLQTIIDEINQYVTPNYFAILERLKYFQVRLNRLLFDSCLPCDLLFSIFHTYFEFSNHQFVFIQPVKDYQYQYLALLFAVVDITIIFTTRDPNVAFVHQLKSNEDFLSHLALKCLTYSRLEKKQTIIAIYAIITVRSSLWVYGSNQNSSIENANAYPMFQKAMTLALNIGLQRLGTNVDYFDFSKEELAGDLYYTSEIPVSCLKKLWNYMLETDATYATIGTPLYIDFHYCTGYHLDIYGKGKSKEKYIGITRKVAETLFSIEPISYNHFYNLCEEIKDFCSTMVSLDNILRFKNKPDQWKKIKLKLDTLKLLVMTAGYGCKLSQEKLVKKNFTEEQLSNTENYLLINEFHNYMNQTFFMTYILVLKFLSDIIEADFPVEFYLSIQTFFKDWYSRPTINAIDFLLVEEEKTKKNDDLLVKPSMKMIEDAILGKLNDKNNFKNVVKYSTHPNSVFEEVSKTYKRVFRLPCYQENYNFFIFSIICWVFIYFIKALLELRNLPRMNYKERIAKLIEITKMELENHNNEMKNNGLNMIDIDDLLNDEIEMDSLIQTFFGEEQFFSPSYDFNPYFSPG